MNIRTVHRQARWVRTYSIVMPEEEVYGGSFSTAAFRECGGRDDEVVIGTEEVC